MATCVPRFPTVILFNSLRSSGGGKGGRTGHAPRAALCRGGILRGKNKEFWNLVASGELAFCIANRCPILRLKCTKFNFGPDPTGGAYSAHPGLLAGFKGHTSKGGEGVRKGDRTKWEWTEEEGTPRVGSHPMSKILKKIPWLQNWSDWRGRQHRCCPGRQTPSRRHCFGATQNL